RRPVRRGVPGRVHVARRQHGDAAELARPGTAVARAAGVRNGHEKAQKDTKKRKRGDEVAFRVLPFRVFLCFFVAVPSHRYFFARTTSCPSSRRLPTSPSVRSTKTTM